MNEDPVSAFPFGHISEQTGQPVNGWFSPGMMLRDYFAARAMQALLRGAKPQDGHWDIKARAAYEIADEMLGARE
jgi:hypothetical protein